jgi:hypothetical protein
MVSNQIAPRAEVTVEAPTATKAAFTDIEIPTWNLGERIPIAPQVWDANTPQGDVGTTEEDVNLINLDPSEITPAVPEDVRKSPKEKQKKKRRRSAQQETDGRLVIRLKTAGSAQPADATEATERPGGTTDIHTETVHSAEEGAILATGVADVQEPMEPVPGTDEVQPTNGVEPVVETVEAPTPMIRDQTPEEESARILTDTKQETIQVSSQSTPMSMGATAEVAVEIAAEPMVREQATEIMMLLETVMQNVCAWSERIEAQTSATAERGVIILKRQLENCETSLKRKNTALSEVEKGQVELQKALEAKDAELAKVTSGIGT